MVTTTECTQHHPTCGCGDARILADLRRSDCILVTVQVPWRDRLLTRTIRVSRQQPARVDPLAMIVRDVVRAAEWERQRAVDAAAPRWSPQEVLDILNGKDAETVLRDRSGMVTESGRDDAATAVRTCDLAPRHDPDHSGVCRQCGEPVPAPFFIRYSDPVTALLTPAGSLGAYIPLGAAQALVDAVYGAASAIVSRTMTFHREVWAYVPEARDHALNRLRRSLAAHLADEELLPVCLPVETRRYLTGWLPDGGTEVPTVIAESYASNDTPGMAYWDRVEVTLTVAVRSGRSA